MVNWLIRPGPYFRVPITPIVDTWRAERARNIGVVYLFDNSQLLFDL